MVLFTWGASDRQKADLSRRTKKGGKRFWKRV